VVSFINNKAMSHESAVTVAETEQGRKYGYFLKKAEPPKIFGNLSAGLAREPPISGPTVIPKDQVRGKIANAWAIFVESVISIVILFITPMFPFRAPLRHRLRTRLQNVVDNPKHHIDADSPKSPIKSTGLRPIWSDIRLQ